MGSYYQERNSEYLLKVFTLVSLASSLFAMVFIIFMGKFIIVSLLGEKWELEQVIITKIGIAIALRHFGSQLLHALKSFLKDFRIAFFANLC